MKFSIKDFFSKCDRIRKKLRIWSHLLKKFLMDNFIFCAVWHHNHCDLKKTKQKLKIVLEIIRKNTNYSIKCLLTSSIRLEVNMSKKSNSIVKIHLVEDGEIHQITVATVIICSFSQLL